MRKSSLFNHLASFSPEPTKSAFTESHIARSQPEGLDGLVAAARQQGAACAREEALTLQKQTEEELENRYLERLSAARAQWTREIMDPLQKSWLATLDELNKELADIVAEALSVFVAEAQKRRIVEAFIAEVREVFGDSVSTTIKIDGPADVVALTGAALRRSGLRVETMVRSEPQIRARVDRTIVRARLDAWVSELAMIEECARHG